MKQGYDVKVWAITWPSKIFRQLETVQMLGCHVLYRSWDDIIRGWLIFYESIGSTLIVSRLEKITCCFLWSLASCYFQSSLIGWSYKPWLMMMFIWDEFRCKPARGGPIIVPSPAMNVSSPWQSVMFSRPTRSTATLSKFPQCAP